MNSASCLLLAFLILAVGAFNARGVVGSTCEQPLAGFAWSPRQIPVVIQESPDYAHDAVLQAMRTWNLAQTWFSDTYHVPSRPYTFVEAQQLGESYVKVTFNQTQTRDDWALTSPYWWWNNDGVFYKIAVSISIDLSVRDGDLSPLQLRSLATAALGFALGLKNTVFAQTDLLNWYGVDHNVVVPSTLNLYAVALLSMVVTKNEMPESPVALPANIPYETPSESAITESASTTTQELAVSSTESVSSMEFGVQPQSYATYFILVIGAILGTGAVLVMRSRSVSARKESVCPGCGGENPLDSDFCGRCGRSLRDETRVY